MDGDNDEEKDKIIKKDKLIQDYGTVLRESGLLTTFSGILFGFLLNIAIVHQGEFGYVTTISLLTALFSITVAISLFVMPVIYHHLEYPYTDLEKFKARSHRFTLFGMIPAGITLYLGLEIALSTVFSEFAFLVSSAPFVLVYILFRMRK